MTTPNLKLQQHDAQHLASGYRGWFRKVEILSIVGFFSLVVALGVHSAPAVAKSPWLTMAALMVGYIFADFVSGFVHWMADTWGSTTLPVLGPALVRPFREHHVAPKAMTLHDYVETNGANCLISIPVAVMLLFVPLEYPGYEALGLFTVVSLTSMIFWVMMTNQFHKWAHFEPHELPGLVKWLQRNHLILPVDHHDVHHTAPFDTYYCITTGWLNWPLAKLGFFRAMERLVTWATGMVPRADDIGLDAAVKVATAGEQAKSPDAQVNLARP